MFAQHGPPGPSWAPAGDPPLHFGVVDDVFKNQGPELWQFFVFGNFRCCQRWGYAKGVLGRQTGPSLALALVS
jgi:hypothetical protein